MNKKDSKKHIISEEDQLAFREALRDVKRISHTKITPHLPPPIQSKPLLKESTKNEVPFSDYESLEPVSSDDLLEYKRPGIQHKVLRKLRTGQYNVKATLDLHGMTIAEARGALFQFLLKCQKKGICHVLIIHGKGQNSNKPILKNKLNHWLRQAEQILAFCSATIKDGRSGALYALLKNQQGEI